MAKIKKVEELNSEISPIQKEYNDLKSNFAKARIDLEDFENGLKDKNMYIDKLGTIKEDSEIWAVFWNVMIYRHYDRGYSIYDHYKGVVKLSEENEEVLKKVLLYWEKMDFEEKRDIFLLEGSYKDLDLFPKNIDPPVPTDVDTYGTEFIVNELGDLFNDYDKSDMIGDVFCGVWKFAVTPNTFTITCLRKDPDESEVRDGSELVFRITNKNELSKIKNVYKQKTLKQWR